MAIFNGTPGDDTFTDTVGENDQIHDGGGGNDTFQAGGGDDVVTITGGIDSVQGGDGTDTLIIDYGAFSSNFGSPNGQAISNFSDTSVSFGGIERLDITMGSGNDNLNLFVQSVTARMGNGDDTISTAGALTLDLTGGDGIDRWLADFNADGAAINLNLNLAQSVMAAGRTIAGFERISLTTGSGDDLIVTHTGLYGDTIVTGLGADTVTVFGGVDSVNGGGGVDTLVIDFGGFATAFGSPNGQTISNFSNTTISFSDIERLDITMGSGSDNLNLFVPTVLAAMGDGNDTISTAGALTLNLRGGAGVDLWQGDFTASATAINLDLNLTQSIMAAGRRISAFERINLTAGSGNDAIATHAGVYDDIVRGGAGDDIITIFGGADAVYGGDGTDTLVIDYSGFTTGFGSPNGQTISNFFNTSVSFDSIERLDITTGSGNETLNLFAPVVIASLGDGNDSISTTNAVEVDIDGGAGADLWQSNYAALGVAIDLDLNLASSSFGAGTIGGIERVTLTGTALGDVIRTRVGDANDGLADTVNGGDGDDVITVGGGQDTVNGGDGFDTLIIDWSTETSAVGSTGSAFSDFTNTVVNHGGIERFVITTGSGADTLVTYGGNDNLNGGAGNDSLSAGAGDDVLIGGLGDDVLNGGDGVDAASYADAAAAVSVSLLLTGAQATGGAGSDTLISIEALIGSAFNDTLAGDTAANRLSGGDGNDVLNGGIGNDWLDGGAGGDRLLGGGGFDTVDYSGATGAVGVDLNDTAVQNTGGSGRDRLVNVENLVGSAFGDRFVGNGVANVLTDTLGGNDRLEGMGGNDVLSITRTAGAATLLRLDGGADDDTLGFQGGSRFLDTVTLIGGDGNDVITSVGSGATTIEAGVGNDTVTIDARGGVYTVFLGAGSDTLRLGSTEGAAAVATGSVVRDFQTGAGGDVLDLSAFLGGGGLTGYTAGSNPFASGHARLLASGQRTLLQIDRDGGGDDFITVLTFNGTAPANWTAYNLGGLSPTGSPAPALAADKDAGPATLPVLEDMTAMGFGDGSLESGWASAVLPMRVGDGVEWLI